MIKEYDRVDKIHATPDIRAEVVEILMRIDGDQDVIMQMAYRITDGIQDGGNDVATAKSFAHRLEALCTEGEIVAL